MIAPVRLGPMSIDAQIPKGFWPKIRWFMTYGASWMLPLVAIERFADEHYWVGWILVALSIVDWGVVSTWDRIEAIIKSSMSHLFVAPDKAAAFADSLYVGQMQASTGKLSQDSTVEISARCFNATGHQLFIHKLAGAIAASKSKDASAKDICDLPPLRMAGQSSDQRIKAKEFFLVFEQRVPQNVADEILSMDTSYDIHFDLGKVDITVASYDDHKFFARLPLWDGIRLYRSGSDQIHTGRVVIARIEPIRITTKLGG
jgi:hypothetical protein